MSKFTDQRAFSLIADLDTSGLDELNQVFNLLFTQPEDNAVLPFGQMEKVHFCRFVVINHAADPVGEKNMRQLVYSTNFDGTLDEHIAEIVSNPAVCSGFYKIFSHCRNFAADKDMATAVRDFILRNEVNVQTFYRGHRGLTVKMIRGEEQIRQSIQAFLDANIVSFAGMDELQIKQKIDKHITTTIPGWKPAEEIKIPRLGLGAFGILLLLPVLLVITGCIAGIALRNFYLLVPCAALLLLLIATVIRLRTLEKKAAELPDEARYKVDLDTLTDREDFVVQNQLTHLVNMRPGGFRRNLQRLALWALNKLALLVYNKGRLGGIATIHFARWLLIDNGKRLLFFSNFDGSWENYLGDFVDRAALGLTLAWSSTEEFPKTRFLVLDGATDEERFKAWARKCQVPTAAWYSAYKELTVKNILNNHRIALGINRKMSREEVKKWLQLI